MHALSYLTGVLSLFFAWYLLPLVQASSYFVINEPAKGAQWTNNAVNPISWTKGLLDGVSNVDIELARLSSDGLIFVARDVPAALSTGGVNIFIQDVPTATDYFLLFVNSTNGIMYASSQQFAISNTANGTTPAPVAGSATVTVSGGPNPTAVFATTFPASANGVGLPAWKAAEGARRQLAAVGCVMALCALGGAWTVL